ncbi:MAG: hypothetical protein KME45_05650 [Stenomitos rutilans HA7619-LM2]|nr:hypothetical protein [Stenomitos rutilans HA7619-LM2]
MQSPPSQSRHLSQKRLTTTKHDCTTCCGAQAVSATKGGVWTDYAHAFYKQGEAAIG